MSLARRLFHQARRQRRRFVPDKAWKRMGIVARRTPTAPWRADPSFFVIGAQRGGTTSFYEALSRHPQVVPAAMKEIHHFDTPWEGRDAIYRSFFPLRRHLAVVARSVGGPAITGEASPSYLLDPRVPDRIAARFPDARFIVLLREPVDRAWSQYGMATGSGWVEGRSFQDELQQPNLAPDTVRENRRTHWRKPWYRRYYIERGRYAEQLARWFERYPRDRFLILRSEDWFADPAGTYAEASAFLGIDAEFVPEFVHLNDGGGRRIPVEDRAWLAPQYAASNEALRELVGISWD